MPRTKGRKTSADPASSARRVQPLTPYQVQLILEEEEDSDLDSTSQSEDESDKEEEAEVVTQYGDIDGAAPLAAAPSQADTDGGTAPGGAGGDAAEADSDSNSSDGEEARSHRPSANFIRAQQAGGEATSRTGRVWSKEPPNHRVRAHPANIMRGRPGPKGRARGVNTPEAALELFLPESLLTKILDETNREGERVAAETNSVHRPVTLLELRAFIGLLLLRGCESDRRCELDDLFYGPFSRPFYRATMTRQRFKHILRILRFDNREDREARKKTDKFAAIREIFTQFNSLLREYYTPSDCITVDETLRAYRGRCGFVIYMPNKPDKYGLLFRDVADARTRYVLNMLPYAGKAEEPDPELHITGASNVVHHLVRPFLNSGRNVTADRFYSSVDLCEELLAQGTTYVGTIIATRRHLPEEAKKPEGRQEQSTHFYWSDNIMLASYNKKKNKNVLIISTQHREPLVSTDAKKKPEVMLFYNQTKGGVDTIDQVIGTYTCRMATRRWPVAVFLMMLDVAALNGWVICAAFGSFTDSKHGARKMFLRELGLSLVRPLIRARPVEGMTVKTRAAVETLLGVKLPPALQPRQESDISRARCALCVTEQQGVGYKRSRHTNVNKIKQRCFQCSRAVCRRHSKQAGPVCNTCMDRPSRRTGEE